ncbi:MAG TPA: transcriptional regulator [Terriglobales bacterium]|nr:transcriptional regulator [Terriglobales bacterium]
MISWQLGQSVRKSLIALLFVVGTVSAFAAAPWAVLGPDGGDVRSFTHDPGNPDHIYLGTSTGSIFQSTDGGHSWARFTHLGTDGYVLDHIAIDPKNVQNVYAAAWSVENQQAGDLFRSHDGGKSWQALPGMHGKSIRAFSLAPSDSSVMIAGALDGVYRSKDGGENWERISSSMQNEIKNIESIAVDPKDPNVVYAGTWHLAWKTADGGATWHHINQGMIDDSDVFSIIVDQSRPNVVFASACSGIYRSETAGDLFKKIQGIPFSARRTRVLRQDPSAPDTVYAGTTEGLWKTTDSGKTWKRVSDPEIVVNDVMVDPRNSKRVLLATDRSGVLASEDGATTFTASNHGYTHRYVTSILADKSDPNAILVGVVNDREWGGVFSSRDAGAHWTQRSTGLGGRDVFALQQGQGGQLVAGTNRGIFVQDKEAAAWRPINAIVNEKVAMRTVIKNKKRVAVKTTTATKSVFDGRVNDLETTPNRWLAATSAGLLISKNDGKSWSGGPIMGKIDLISVEAKGDMVVTATRMHVLISADGGTTWKQADPAPYITSIRGVSVGPGGEILVASREGAFRSADAGATWSHMVNGLPDKNISSVSYDETGKRLLATSLSTGVIFQSDDDGLSWRRGPDSGYPLRHVHMVRGRMLAATPFDGVIAQPEGGDTTASASK